MSAFIATANPGFAPYAMEELRRRFPGIALSGLAPGETFRVQHDEYSQEELVRRLRADEPIFLRHVFPVKEEVAMPNSPEETASALARFAASRSAEAKGAAVAVQVRKSQDSPFPFSSAEGRDLMTPALQAAGAETVARDARWILSVYATKKSIYFGWSAPRDNLSDWPGGAVRFRREEGLISRAAFKLLEAEKTFGLPLNRFSNALDLGAAPGGWSSVLLERGVRVTAVDPAVMHPSLVGHPMLRHLRQNAAELSFAPGSFDLLVCDMSWDPHHTCRIVSQLAPALSAGASGLITLKLMYRKPLQTIADLLEDYREAFDVRRVKQLFHNRDEVTLWVRR
ncbi:SAM-dependent methyltransferase [Cohnella nanjingensis]|uniref:SAM-dependent methyltransferase n=1 Tax=Cohnella nanjingensis TaxID=1387779 RepID=A0A7X0RKI7_9BACL|nr:SAM-dependent methyltransferase [Cohnella nanjingensis]MBB6669177.1 SAM-dependent methyltransferase [Cohnella nanjingensis]